MAKAKATTKARTDKPAAGGTARNGAAARRARRPGEGLKIGDRVEIIPLPSAPPYLIIEDRGYIGKARRKYFRIRPLDGLEEMGITDDRSSELPAEHLRKVGVGPGRSRGGAGRNGSGRNGKARSAK